MNKRRKKQPTYSNRMESKDYELIINEPTHEKDGVLDLIFVPSNFQINKVQIFNKESGVEISDHYPVKLVLPLEGESTIDYQEIEYRNLKNINMTSFNIDICSALSSINNIIDYSTEFDSTCEYIFNTLSKTLEIHAPKIKKLVKVTKHMITNPKIKEARRIKRRAERKFKKSNNEENKNLLRTARKELNKIVSSSRNKYFKNKFDSCKGDVKLTYKIFNELINKGKKSTLPNHSNEKTLANEFANFYKEKIADIRLGLLKDNLNNISTGSSVNTSSSPSFITPFDNFRNVEDEEIKSIIKSLPNKQSPLDPIPYIKIYYILIAKNIFI